MRFLLNGRLRKLVRVCWRLKRAETASVTLECAAVLPIFFLACITLILVMDAVRFQCAENLKLSNTARKLSAAAALTGDLTGGEWIDIRKNKKYAWAARLPGIGTLRVALRARVYPWIGSVDGIGGGEEGEGREEDGRLVYLTDYESVYHTDPNCTHLDLAVFRSTTSEIGNLRNKYGRKYKKCKGFPRGYRGEVYASASGDTYYPSADYGSLVRHVRVARISKDSSLCGCSRCAGGAGGNAA